MEDRFFGGATDTPVFRLLVMSALGFKATVDLSLYFIVCVIVRFTSSVGPANLLATSMA